ncbi:hypothetical protein HaLaN_05255 [Haematococcus lacustris]|uniref:Uncharacterized protein n=1 Tax=Haematococcus lacustris TaxID=44745 RepID=A0A699YIU0_HAELA|nr:hypothetical protein HaLaN_05255 [Haematococcus lacustris]
MLALYFGLALMTATNKRKTPANCGQCSGAATIVLGSIRRIARKRSTFRVQRQRGLSYRSGKAEAGAALQWHRRSSTQAFSPLLWPLILNGDHAARKRTSWPLGT